MAMVTFNINFYLQAEHLDLLFIAICCNHFTANPASWYFLSKHSMMIQKKYTLLRHDQIGSSHAL